MLEVSTRQRADQLTGRRWPRSGVTPGVTLDGCNSWLHYHYHRVITAPPPSMLINDLLPSF